MHMLLDQEIMHNSINESQFPVVAASPAESMRFPPDATTTNNQSYIANITSPVPRCDQSAVILIRLNFLHPRMKLSLTGSYLAYRSIRKIKPFSETPLKSAKSG